MDPLVQPPDVYCIDPPKEDLKDLLKTEIQCCDFIKPETNSTTLLNRRCPKERKKALNDKKPTLVKQKRELKSEGQNGRKKKIISYKYDTDSDESFDVPKKPLRVKSVSDQSVKRSTRSSTARNTFKTDNDDSLDATEVSSELTKNGRRILKCQFCEKTFWQLCNLKAHLRVHTRERPFECKECSKKFFQLSHLRNHELIHAGIKPYQCPVCTRTFRQLSSLNNHKMTHTDEKPFICDICGNGYQQEGTLTRHKMIHSDERPFECSVCKKTFRYRFALTNHLRVHSGQKPFECEVCKRQFSQYSIRAQHMLIHANDRSYECFICKKTFNHQSSYKRHFLVHRDLF